MLIARKITLYDVADSDAALRRRRWKEKGDSQQSYSNTYELHVEGMKTTKEFGAFLKEEFGLQPDEYNKLWKSITG